MNIKTALFSLCITFFASSFAQEVHVPNYEEMQEESSLKIYKPLLQRYLSNDTTLTTGEYHHLYYGFTLQEDYNPYKQIASQQALSSLFSLDSLSADSCAQMLQQALLSVADVPFDLRSIHHVIYAYNCLGETQEAALWSAKFSGLVRAILASGTGESKESPVHIIYPSDEYVVMGLLGVQAKESRLLTPHIDEVLLVDNDFEKKHYFFDVSRMRVVFDYKYNPGQ